LYGAGLFSKLLAFVQPNVVTLNILNTHHYSLECIRSPTTKLQTCIANRVEKIQQLTDIRNWRHIPTSVKPADCASRGLSPN